MTADGSQGNVMSSSREHHVVDETARLTELRVMSAQQAAELARLRADLAPLVGMPAQLDALSRLWQEQLANLRERHDRDVAELRAQQRAAHADLAGDVEQLQSWQTWALRIVLGAVILGVFGLLVAAPGPS